MTQNRKCIAAIALLLTAVAAGCGGAGFEDEDLGGCVEVAGEDGVYVECPDSADGEEQSEGEDNQAVPVRNSQQAYYKWPCKQTISGGCVSNVEINIR